MKVKCINNYDSYSDIGRIYSVVAIEIYFDSELEGKKKRKVRFVYASKSCFEERYPSTFYYTPAEYFEILSNVIPINWAAHSWGKSIYVKPKIFQNLFDDFYNDVPEALDTFRKESLKIIAFDSQRDMRGFFAEELLDFIKENGYNPENLSQWAKDYNLELLKEMYDQEVHPDIIALIDDFGLYDWNPDLAIPEQELKEKLMKWSEEGKVESPSTISFQDILEKYAN